MKTCDICATLNFKENNYCTHCGNKFVVEHICPFCGEINKNSSVCLDFFRADLFTCADY